MNYVTDIRDLPLDTYDGGDGNDALLAMGKPITVEVEDIDLPQVAANEARMMTSANTAGLSTIYVPFKRTIKLGTVGLDCYAVKRALARSGHGVWGQWGTKPRLFGPFAVNNLKLFQKEKGLKADGVYGLNTHLKMAPY